MRKNYLFLLIFLTGALCFTNKTIAQPFAPSVQASNVQINYKYPSGTAATITWTRGNGSNCIVALRRSTSGYFGPPSSTVTNIGGSYSSSYGGGYSLGGGDSYVIYGGTGTAVYVYNLSPNVIYEAYVYEYNSYTIFSTTYYFNTNSSGYLGFNTLAAPPTSCGSAYFASPTNSSATVYFTAGNGNGRMITMCTNNLSGSTPTNGYYYSPSATLGAGSALGSAHDVYDGAGTSVNVTNLLGATTYKVYDYEYTSGNYPTYSTYNFNTKNYISCNTYTFNTTNIPPTISSVPSATICQNTYLTTAALSGLGDGSNNETQNITITGTSNNQSLISNANIITSYANPNTYGYLYIYPTNGQYGTAVITVTVNDGWSVNNITTTSFTITVLPFPGPAGAIVGSSPICAGSTQSYSIAPTTNTTGYNWTVPSTFTISSGANTNQITVTTLSTSTSGTITVYGTNANGCGNGASSSKSIQVDMQPAAPNAGPDQPIVCSNAAFTNATATTAPDGGVWSWLPGNSATIGNTTSNLTSVSPLNGSPTAHTYKLLWTVTRAGSVCPSKTDTLVITADFNNVACTPASVFSYGPSSDVASNKVCVNTPINFTDLSVSANTWLWDFEYTGSVGTFTSSAQYPVFTYTTTGTYTVYLKIHSNTTGLDYTSTQTLNVISAPATPNAISGNTSGICEGGSSGQQGYSIVAVTDATGYNWTIAGGGHIDSNPSPTSILASFGAGATSGNVSVSASNSCGTSGVATLSVTVNPLPSSAGNLIVGPATVCQGQTPVSYSVAPMNNTASYTWTDILGVQTNTANTFTTGIGASAVNGQISVFGTNACGNGDTVKLALTINPLPVNSGNISGVSTIRLCPAPGSYTYAISPVIANASSYNWTLPAGASIVGGNGLDTAVIHYTNAIPGGLNQITVNGTNACGTSSTSNFQIFVNAPTAPQICMVSVDTTSTYNIIYWDKTVVSNTDSFKIYREDVTNVYKHIGTVPYNNLSEYHDMDPLANPNTTTKRYKISSIDSCGNESSLSPYHNTIYIIDNGSGTFSWNPLYTIEGSPNPVNNYVLMVDTNNTNFWKQAAITAGTQQTIIDIHYANYSAVANWRVETVWNISCTSTMRTSPNSVASAVVKSKSNITNNRQTTGINNAAANAQINISPNPTTGNLTINFVQPANGKVTIKVTSMLGQEVYAETLNTVSDKQNIDLSKFESGTYIVQITTSNATVTKRIIKN